MSTQPEALRLADVLDRYYEDRGPSDEKKAAIELRRLHQHELALIEWLEKTDWVQVSAQPGELGRHRADVINRRFDRLQQSEREGWRHAAELEQERQRLQFDAAVGAHAKRLALELECLLLSCDDTAAVTKRWQPAHDALEALESGDGWRQSDAITAIKQALAAPVQEHQINQLEKFKNHVLANADALGVVLDAPAAQRQWVGLTETEVDECYESVMFNPDTEPTRVLVYQAIEAKLKEKNGGVV